MQGENQCVGVTLVGTDVCCRMGVSQTSAKYSPNDQFKLHETKSNIDQLRQEVEHAEMQECMVEFKAKPMPQYVGSDGGGRRVVIYCQELSDGMAMLTHCLAC